MPKINQPFGINTNFYWIGKIPDKEIREKFIHYTKLNHKDTYYLFLRQEQNSFSDLFLQAFIWGNTPEGHEYWSNYVAKF